MYFTFLVPEGLSLGFPAQLKIYPIFKSPGKEFIKIFLEINSISLSSHSMNIYRILTLCKELGAKRLKERKDSASASKELVRET